MAKRGGLWRCRGHHWTNHTGTGGRAQAHGGLEGARCRTGACGPKQGSGSLARAFNYLKNIMKLTRVCRFAICVTVFFARTSRTCVVAFSALLVCVCVCVCDSGSSLHVHAAAYALARVYIPLIRRLIFCCCCSMCLYVLTPRHPSQSTMPAT
jgi:hypothetical protein